MTGLEWTTSNASVVSLSSDDPPVLTAVAPGTAIVYVVGMPILVTVYSGTSLPRRHLHLVRADRKRQQLARFHHHGSRRAQFQRCGLDYLG